MMTDSNGSSNNKKEEKRRLTTHMSLWEGREEAHGINFRYIQLGLDFFVLGKERGEKDDVSYMCIFFLLDGD